MRRTPIVFLLVIVLTLPAYACKPGPTPTVTVSPLPTATPVLAEVTATPAISPTSSPIPTPTPVTGPIDLGVPAGDAYSPHAMAVDPERGLAYVVSGYGDAAESEEQSVLSVVSVTRGEVQATVALPRPFRGSTSMALAPAGDRLFIAGGEDDVLLVVATGLGTSPLGQVLALKPDVRAMALDSTSLRLYTVGENQMRVFDAADLREIQQIDAPIGLPAPPAPVFLAVNAQASRLYLASPASDLVTVHRTDDLHKVADILPAGSPESLTAGPNSSQTYLLLRGQSDGVEQVAVIEGDQVLRIWQGQDGFHIRAVVSDDDVDRAYVWETADGGESRLRAVDPVSGQMVGITPLPTSEIVSAVVRAGRLASVTWNNVFLTVRVDSGEIASLAPLGVALRDAAIDEGTGRLFVIDSVGTIHVLDTASLRRIDTWPRVLGPVLRSVYAAPLSVIEGRLFVPDYDADETVVLDAATGERVATIPKAGQVTFDATRHRLFVTQQGVFIVDPQTYTIVGSIEETVRKTLFSGEPSAMAARYDAGHDLLFVTMTNNTPGSSSRTWLQIYDGDTLQRLDTSIQTDQQFLSGLALDREMDRVYVASGFPGHDVAVFSAQGEQLARLQGLSGQLFLDAPSRRLYVAGWDGLVTVDTASLDVLDYRRLPTAYSELMVFDARYDRLFTTGPNSANLFISSPHAPEPVAVQAVAQLPSQQIRQLAIADDGTLFVVSEAGDVYRRSGEGWQDIGRMLPPLGTPAIHPAPETSGVVFAILRRPDQYGQSFGIFRSVDGGHTWQPAMRGLRDFAVRDMALSPDFAADGTAFVLAGEDGVFRTMDGGDRWERISDVSGQYIALASTATEPPALLMLARSPDASDMTWVFAPVSTAGGLEQIGIIGAAMLSGSDALAMSPDFVRDGVALAGLGQAGLFLSQDFGHTWRQLPPRPAAFTPIYTILFSPDFATDHTVYALIAPSYFGQEDRSLLYRSIDGGQTWQQAVDLDPFTSALAMARYGRLWAGDTRGTVRPLDPAQLTWEIAREPTPTPVPTPAEPPAGLFRPTGVFAPLWERDSEVQRHLGWAAEEVPRWVPAAFQPFERGAMIWRGDTSTIYVLYDDGLWEAFEDTWTPEEPERDPNIQPPVGFEQPIRGFGKLWRGRPGIRDRVGWALQPEVGYTSPVQSFERGTTIGVGSSVYVLTRVAGGPATWLQR